MEKLSTAVGENAWTVVRVAFAVLLLVLAVLIPVANVPVEEAVAMAALVAAAFAIAALSPATSRRWGPRVQSLKLGGLLEIGLFEAKQAAGREGEEDPADPDAPDDDAEPPAPDSLLSLRLKLEAKLAYIAKYMLGTPERPDYLTVGSLEYDGYLSELEGRTAARVMSWRDEDLTELTTSQAVAFINDADKVITNMRAGVLQGMARKALSGADWKVKQKRRGGSRRPDLVASKDGAKVRVAAVFVLASESEILNRARERLEGRIDKDGGIRRHIVVIPDRSDHPTDGPDANPRVIKLQELVAAADR